jgi:hypothetical protein
MNAAFEKWPGQPMVQHGGGGNRNGIDFAENFVNVAMCFAAKGFGNFLSLFAAAVHHGHQIHIRMMPQNACVVPAQMADTHNGDSWYG